MGAPALRIYVAPQVRVIERGASKVSLSEKHPFCVLFACKMCFQGAREAISRVRKQSGRVFRRTTHVHHARSHQFLSRTSIALAGPCFAVRRAPCAMHVPRTPDAPSPAARSVNTACRAAASSLRPLRVGLEAWSAWAVTTDALCAWPACESLTPVRLALASATQDLRSSTWHAKVEPCLGERMRN